MITKDDARDLQVVAEDHIMPTEAPPKSSGVTKSKSESKQSSAAWQYFEKESNVTARCNICNKVYKHGGNTTNLLQHLSTSHMLFCSQTIGQKRKARVTSGSSDESIDDPPQPKRVKVKPQGKLTTIDEAFERTNSFSGIYAVKEIF
ncbi:hypothetical protein ACS0PU_000008 [Formica fusca]